MRRIGTEGTSSKVRELYEAVRREQDGMGDDVTIRLTCESALREAGVDEALIAKKLKEQLEAKQTRWTLRRKNLACFPIMTLDSLPSEKLSGVLAAIQPQARTITHLLSST
jgi:hypothetical protein